MMRVKDVWAALQAPWLTFIESVTVAPPESALLNVYVGV
jgi:hypothetical protein